MNNFSPVGMQFSAASSWAILPTWKCK
jgi:hypothetical protein